MSTEGFVRSAKSAKAELTAELASTVVQEGLGSFAGGPVGVPRNTVRVVVQGREVDNFTAWDFLGLSHHPRIERAAGRALREYGAGRPEPRGLGGFARYHALCEERFASFYGAEGATLFSPRSQCVLSVITALCRQGDLVLAPSGGAWAVADACAVADVEYEEFYHEDDLQRRLARIASGVRAVRRVLVCAEAVSTVTGEVTNMARVFEVADRYGCLTLVDESVAFGLLGSRGAGGAEVSPRHPSLVGRMVSFSGAFGVEVSAMVGPKELRELLYRRSYYLRRECAPSPLSVCAALELIDLAETSVFNRARATTHGVRVETSLREQGWKVSGGKSVPLVCLTLETPRLAREVQEAFLVQGALVDAIDGAGGHGRGGVVRIAVGALHSDDAVGRLLSSAEQVYLRLLS